MKLFLLAAAAVIATPAIAQTTAPSTTDQTAPPATAPADTMQTTPADGTAPATAAAPADAMTTTTQTTAPSVAAPADGSDPVGGYAPAGTGLSGPRAPGAAVTFQPSQTPDQAFPAPAPLASYPICKAGQFDNCMQASDARRRPARRRR